MWYPAVFLKGPFEYSLLNLAKIRTDALAELREPIVAESNWYTIHESRSIGLVRCETVKVILGLLDPFTKSLGN